MISTAGRPFSSGFACLKGDTGMPRPLSTTLTEPSGRSTTRMSSQWPASASSIALSTTSHTRWCRPRSSLPPTYMPGRARIAATPSSTWMLSSS